MLRNTLIASTLAVLAAVSVWSWTAPLGGSQTPAQECRLRPGLVDWHPDWNAARAAAVRSGRPLLLFQAVGRLDDWTA